MNHLNYIKIYILPENWEKQEQSLAIKNENDIALIIVWGLQGVRKIIDSISKFGKVYAIIGGLHGFDVFEVLENIEKVCPSHCTKYQKKIKSLYPEKYLEGGVGEIFDF